VRACSYYHLQNLIVKQLLNILPADAAAAAATAAAAGTKKNLKPANLIRCSSAPATVAPRATAAKHNGAGGAGSGGAGGGGGGSKKLVPPPDVTFQEMLAKPGAIEMLKGHIGKENAYLGPFCTEKGSIYQDRLGTDIGKATQKKRCAFLQGSRQRRTSPLQSCSRWSATTTSSSRQPALARVVRTETFPSFLRHRILKNPNLCQDRLGTTREQLKRRNIFLQGLVVVVRMLTRMMYRARVMRNLTYRANCREAGAWRYRSALL
jgi:hypothetical protein